MSNSSQTQTKKDIWSSPLGKSWIKTDEVKIPEMLFGYLLGPFGALLSSGIFTSILQNYFTDVLKLNLNFLTVLQLVSTVLIVIANLVVGQLIERTHALAGKARPWILLSALTLSISSVLMFIVPFQNQTARYIWIAIAYNLYYSFAYPIYNTANSTLVPLSTRDSKARGGLASMTNIAGLGTMGAGSMIFPMLVSFYLKENQGRWFLVMLAIGIFSALTIFLQFKMTRERVTEENFQSGNAAEAEAKPSVSFKDQIHAAAGEKSWWIILIFYLVFQFSGAIKNGSMTYFCKWFINNSTPDAWGAAQSLLSIAGAVPMAVAALFTAPLCNKFSCRIVNFAGFVIGVIGGIIALAGGNNLIVVAVGVALKCLGSSPACYMILAMLADVIDHIEWKTGIRTDGLTMSIYSSLMVAATPVMNAVLSAMLNASGYDQSINVGEGVQSAAAQGAIQVAYIGIETVAYAICGLLILTWTVEKNLPKEQEEIKKRKNLA